MDPVESIEPIQRRTPATLVLVLANLAVFVWMMALSGSGGWSGFGASTLERWGANVPALVWEGHEYWRLLTSTLVHLNLLHLAMNLLALWYVGRILEMRWGAARFLAVYLVSGLAGSLASIGYYRFMHLAVASVGASGAIAGLIGATAVVGQLMGGENGRRIRNAMLRWAAMVVVFGLAVGADNAAHAGGFVAGALMAFPVEKLGVARRGGRAMSGLAIALYLGLAGAAFYANFRYGVARIYQF